MAITKSAKRAIRGSARKRLINLHRKDTLKDNMKMFNKLISEGKKKEAEALVPAVYQAIDKAAKRGIIKRNNASNKKSLVARSLAR